MKIWIEPQEINVSLALQTTLGGHPLVGKILARRGITEVEQARGFLDPAHYNPAPPTDLPGINQTVERLETAIRHGELTCVWGDFDVDGQTATTLLVSTLRDLGAQVIYYIPVRESESHGVHVPRLKEIIQRGVRLVLTCDTGIAAHQAVDFARNQGVDLIVTDHHDLPPSLPEAYAVVNPKLLPAAHPLSTLPGVGVAYKLAEALYEQASQVAGAEYNLDLVALGIVADLAVQTGEARYLLQRGLQTLRETPRMGLQIMMELAELNPAYLTEDHISYILGPRLNALGRLSDANAAVELLTTSDLGRARLLAMQLEGLNAQRQLLTNQVFQAALAQIERNPSLLEHAALVLDHPTWPAGVIGVVASRLVEHFHRPVVLISAPPDGVARGSARSVEGVDISAAITPHTDMLINFGGHPMAAGLAILPERIPEFRQALSRTVQATLSAAQVQPRLAIDDYLPLSNLSLELVADLERLAPFGPGNPPVTLVSPGLVVKSQSSIGRDGVHLQIIVEDEQKNTHKVIWWDGASRPLPEGRFDLAYVARPSDYHGEREVQVEWIDARPAAEVAVELRPKKPPIAVQDYRRHPQPIDALRGLLEKEEENPQIWSEAEERVRLARLGLTGHNRYSLASSQGLVIWTSPPDQRELRAALKRVSPEVVYLFGLHPLASELESFLKRLTGLVKYALKSKGGMIRVSTLAAETAQRETAVRKGLAWLEARGFLRVVSQNGDEIQLGQGNRIESPELERVTAQLKAILEETAAYRTHFARTAPERLVSFDE